MDSYTTNDDLPEIVERDDGFVGASYFSKIYLAPYEKWPKAEKAAIKYAYGRTLDLGCGSGRHSLYLQKKGLVATGLDRSPMAIKLCKLRGLKNTKQMSIEDIGKFSPNSFDIILMMGNNLGLLSSFKKGKVLLKKMHDITSDEGIIIAETTDPGKTKSKYHLEYQKNNIKKGRMRGQVKIRIRHNVLIGPWFDYLLVSKSELSQLLLGTGWKISKILKKEKGRYYVILKKLIIINKK